MVLVNPRPDMTFGGTSAPACYAELKNVGKLSAAEVEALSAKLCAELAAAARAGRPHLHRVHQCRRRAVGLGRLDLR
jgi:hypothetical protein